MASVADRWVLAVDGVEVGPIEVAGSRRARGRGLLGRGGLDGALWLPGIRSVHTIGMHFAIDVAWVDRAGRVLRTATLRPGRVSGWWPRAAGVVEAEAGRFAEWGLADGAVAEVRASPGGDPTAI